MSRGSNHDTRPELKTGPRVPGPRGLSAAMAEGAGLQVRILATEHRTDERGHNYRSYRLEVYAGKMKGKEARWEVNKRYSEFRELKDALKEKLPEKVFETLPKLSSKKPTKLTKKQVQKRHDSLVEFITAAANSATIGMDELLFEFLDAPSAVLNSEAVTSLWQQQAAVDRELAKKRGTLRERKRVTKQGPLKKKGTGKGLGSRTNWTTRWIVLSDYAIEWHDSRQAFDAGSKANSEPLPLVGAKVVVIPDEKAEKSHTKYSNAFEIQFPKSCRVGEGKPARSFFYSRRKLV